MIKNKQKKQQLVSCLHVFSWFVVLIGNHKCWHAADLKLDPWRNTLFSLWPESVLSLTWRQRLSWAQLSSPLSAMTREKTCCSNYREDKSPVWVSFLSSTAQLETYLCVMFCWEVICKPKKKRSLCVSACFHSISRSDLKSQTIKLSQGL